MQILSIVKYEENRVILVGNVGEVPRVSKFDSVLIFVLFFLPPGIED